MLHRLLSAGLLLAGLAGVSGCGSGSGSPGLPATADGQLGDTDAVVTRTTVAPAQLPGSGGEVQIRAGVEAPEGTAVTEVWASVSSGSDIRQVSLQCTGEGTYSGTTTLPANTAAADRAYRVVVCSSDTAGRTYQAASTLGVTVLAGICQDGAPPSPPIPTIASAEVTPALVSYDGGDVTIAMELSNSEQVSTVQAVIGGPDGNELLDLVWDGDRYQATLAVPGDTGTDSVEYSVRVRAKDAAGQMLVNEALTGFAVKGPSPPPLPPFT